MYYLSPASSEKLVTAHPILQKVVRDAIATTVQDFTVFEAVRSLERQREYYRRGVTKTMRSKHLRQPDGYAHAVDLLPWIDGGPRWDWGAIWPIAEAMRNAAKRRGAAIRWGGVWDRPLSALGSDLKREVNAYAARHPGPDFLDGPHYELA